MPVPTTGYIKYVYQAWVDPEYHTVSFHLYNLAWLVISVLERDPLYYVLFRYPFQLLINIEKYVDMRGRKILFDEHSITLHCVDHLLHGMISLRVLLYYFWGEWTILGDILTIPFITIMSTNMVKMQLQVKPA